VRAAAGQVATGGVVIDLARPALRRCLDAGIVLVPERRDSDGLALSLSVRENLALPLLRRHGKPWRVGSGWEDDLVHRSVAGLGIHPPEGDAPVGWLSGGNRQKVLFGKWLATGPRLLVLHEPTQGVDVGARAQLLGLVRQAAASGVAILIASIEAEDLAAVCDRVLITRDGCIAAELTAPCDDQQIIQLTYQDSPAEASS
jgi:ribose transport system ATP-binding protein